MKLKLIIIASLLASCEMVPDEVSASGFTSRYDFLGANSLKGDGNEVGNEQGIMLTATYKLKPQSIRLVEPIRIIQQPSVLDKKSDELSFNDFGNKLKDNLEQKANDLINKTVDDMIDLSKQPNPIKETTDYYSTVKNFFNDCKNLFYSTIVASVLFFILLFSSLMKKNKKSNGT